MYYGFHSAVRVGRNVFLLVDIRVGHGYQFADHVHPAGHDPAVSRLQIYLVAGDPAVCVQARVPPVSADLSTLFCLSGELWFRPSW